MKSTFIQLEIIIIEVHKNSLTYFFKQISTVFIAKSKNTSYVCDIKHKDEENREFR